MTRTEGKFGTNHTFAQIIYIIHCDSKLHSFFFFYCKRCCCLLRRIAAVGTKKPKKSQTDGSFYRPQTKFAKVMFLHVSVILSTGGGVPGQVHPRDQVHPQTRYPSLGPGTPPDQVHPQDQVHPLEPSTPPLDQVHPTGPGTPWDRYSPWDQVHPPGAVHAGRYGQQVGDTHPTGMHSCFNYLEMIVLFSYPLHCF